MKSFLSRVSLFHISVEMPRILAELEEKSKCCCNLEKSTTEISSCATEVAASPWCLLRACLVLIMVFRSSIRPRLLDWRDGIS